MSTIITRAGKGSPLTNDEVDANFNNLNSTKVEVFGSLTAKYVYAAPNAIDGTPSFRLLVASDVPTLNQNTTGTAANVTGIVAVANGGTGASTAAGARTALGLGTIATQDANAVAVTGGTINGTTVGSTTAAAGSFSTLNSSGATRLGGLSGNQSLQVNNVASAVNYAQIVGATTGGYPAFQVQGTDTNVGLLFDAKGSGISYFRAQSSKVQFAVGAAASSVNYILAFGGATGAYPTLSATGSDANIGFVFNAKGTAAVAFQTSSTLQAQVSYTASAVNYLQLTGAVTTGAPELSAQGSDANINLKLTPKGTGVLQFGTYTAGVVAQAGYITITDAGGTSRRLLVG